MSQTWVIKDTAPVDPNEFFSDVSINFTSNNESFTSLGVVDGGATCELQYNGMTYAGVDLGDPQSSGVFEWDNEAYKTLVFDTAPTGILLAWLKKNADKQAEEKPDVITALITDRTNADVRRAQYLQSLSYELMTTAEKAEWSSDLKGTYNCSDLNRVGRALNWLRDQLNTVCGLNIQLIAKTDWTDWDEPTLTQMQTYQHQVQQIRDAIAYPEGTANAPSIQYLNFEDANNIERILQTCDQLITNIQFAFRYTGAAECATGGLL